jgi:N utilization substance protein A
VRLAAQLTGWNLDIISETRLRNMMTEARNNLLEFEGVTEEMIDTLFSLGYNKLEHIAEAEPSELAQIPGYSTEAAECIIAAANDILARPTHKTEEDMTPEELQRKNLQMVRGIGAKVAKTLHDAGYITYHHIAFLSQEETDAMAEAAGIPSKKGRQLWHAARDHVMREEGLDEETFETRRVAWLRKESGEDEPVEPAVVLSVPEDPAAAAAELGFVTDDDDDEDDEPVVPAVVLSKPTDPAPAGEEE